MTAGWLLALTLAGAQEPAAEVSDETPPAAEEGAEEVIVYSQYLVERARKEVIGAAKDAGYINEFRRGDHTILRHDAVWKGEVVLYDDGRVEVRRQPVQFRPPFRNVTPASWLACVIVPLCIRPNGQMVSKRRFLTYERMAWGEVEDEVAAFHAAISDFGVDVKVDDLPRRLSLLWKHGVPLDGGSELVSAQERKSALLQYYDTRTDSPWGDAVRAAVLSFVRAEVQHSEHPFTDEEIAAHNAARQSLRAFDLSAQFELPTEEVAVP